MRKWLQSQLTALGPKPLPESVDAAGRTYTLARVFKNDFFAITAQYSHGSDSVLVKINRRAWFLIFPMAWVGRILARREMKFLDLLGNLDGVPRLIGPLGSTGFSREYIEGQPMRKGEHVPDDFHASLRALVSAMHARGVAYVDLEKCENVLVGADGKPYLFDFQISWHWSKRRGGDLWPIRSITRRLQASDCYHLVKLQRRTRRDQLDAKALADSYRRPWYVRTYTTLTRPLTLLRRALLNRIAPKRGDSERGRV